jgi:membrane protease YdiL (CAAX protease family)
MNQFLPWIRIFLAVFAYIVIAILASMIVRKVGKDLKEMGSRTSPRVLFVGAITNLCVLVTTILLLLFLDRRPIQSLGILFSNKDLAFATIGAIAIFIFATAFVGLLNWSGRFQVSPNKPLKDSNETANFLGGVIVLLIVALQEEVLYRGYITLNLLSFGPVVVIVVSTIIFAAIHLLTNRGSLYQILSWLVSGAVFSYVYLISGSIWVPVVLHFATDLTNLLIFNIVGQFSLFKISPPVTARPLATFRVASVMVLVGILLAFYGATIRLV